MRVLPSISHRGAREHVVGSPPVGGSTARDAAADNDAGVCCRGACNDRLVLALKGRIGNLEGVEDAQLDLFDEVGQRAGNADSTDLALLLERQYRFESAMLLELAASDAAMELDQVEVVGFHSPQAVLDTGTDVLGGMDMLGAHRRVGDASAFGGEKILGAAMRYKTPDQFLAASVVDRGVDEVDARVQHRVEHLLRVMVGNLRPRRRAAQFHRTVAKGCDLEIHATQSSFR